MTLKHIKISIYRGFPICLTWIGPYWHNLELLTRWEIEPHSFMGPWHQGGRIASSIGGKFGTMMAMGWHPRFMGSVKNHMNLRSFSSKVQISNTKTST